MLVPSRCILGMARSTSARVMSKSVSIDFAQVPMSEPNSAIFMPASFSWPTAVSNASSLRSWMFDPSIPRADM